MEKGELVIEIIRNNKVDEIKLSGEMDIFTAEEFERKMGNALKRDKQEYVINAKELMYIDSTGLGTLVSILKTAQKKGSKVRVINLRKNIYKLFHITGLDKIFNIEKEG